MYSKYLVNFSHKGTNAAAGRRPAPPSSRYRTTSRLADRSHQCAFQASAVANNIAMLAYFLSKLAVQPFQIRPDSLHLSSIPDVTNKELLDGPITPNGLFGPQFGLMVSQLKTAYEEAENIRRHVVSLSLPHTNACQVSGGTAATKGTNARGRDAPLQRLRLAPCSSCYSSSSTATSAGLPSYSAGTATKITTHPCLGPLR